MVLILRRMFLVINIAAVVFVAACGGASSDTGVSDRPLVITTTGILADLAKNIVGDDAMVEAIIPAGADPHDFSPTSRQAARLRDADLIIAVGLGLEEGLGDTVAAAEEDGTPVLELGPRLAPLALPDGSPDPHVWLDPVRMAEATALIAAELNRVAPGMDWSDRADRYADELLEAHRRIEARLATVPQSRRLLVTNHDALRYFADRYGFEIVGVVIPGGSTLADPSPAAIAELAEEIRRRDIPAVFAETTEPDRLARALAAEVGDDVAVVELFTGSLGPPESGADTLIGMLETNADRIAEALAGDAQ